jgi:outer membrane protein TolC
MRIPGSSRATAVIAATLTATVLLHAAIAKAQTGVTLRDALHEALRLSPNILLQRQQVLVNRGAELVALGQFDPVVTGFISRNRDPRPLRQDEIAALNVFGAAGANTQVTNTTSYALGVQQPLRSGVTVGVNMDVSTLSDNVSQSVGIPPQTSGRLSFSLRAPLLRNAGHLATTANLSAAEAELAAAQYELVFANAQTVLDTTLAYWDYLAQLRRAAIARDAESRSLQLAEDTRKLIGADELPAAEIRIVSASHSERVATRVIAEQRVAEARRNLAVLMGLPPERLTVMELPADDFPAFDGQPIALDSQMAGLFDLAFRRRADLEAAKRREHAARRRVDAARSGLKPQVDLTVGAGYGTLVEKRVPFDVAQVLGTNRVGPSVFATLAAQIPVRNSAAEGVFLAQSAALDASLIRLKTLADTIGNNILTDVQALARSAQQLAQSIESTGHYRLSVANEQTKRRLGLVTLIDVITVEDRLTNALLAEVEARQTYANAIARLRFDLGTIVLERDSQFDVAIEDLFNPRVEIPR